MQRSQDLSFTLETFLQYHQTIRAQVAAYADMFRAFMDFPQPQNSVFLQPAPELSRFSEVEREIDGLIPRMLGDPRLSAEQSGKVEEFLGNLVAEKTGSPVEWGTFSARSEHGFAQLIARHATQAWRVCKEASRKFPTNPLDPQLWPACLLYEQHLKPGRLPPSQRLVNGINAELIAAQAALAALPGIAAKVAPNEWLFVRTGDGYTIRAFGVEGHFRRSRGLDHLALLVANARRPIDMMSIVSDSRPLDDAAARPRPMGWFSEEEGIVPVDAAGMRSGVRLDHGGRTVKQRAGYQRTYDKDAVGDIRSAIEDVEGLIEAARQDGRVEQVIELEDQKERIEKIFANSQNHRGLTRDLDNPYDKLRPCIAAALNRAYSKLRGAEPPMSELADHFDISVSAVNSTTFCYSPTPCPDWVYDEDKQFLPAAGGILSPPPDQK